MSDLLVLLVPGLLGVALWRAFVTPRAPVVPEDDAGLAADPRGATALLPPFVLAWVANGLALSLGLGWLAGDALPDEPGAAAAPADTASIVETHGLEGVITVQAAANAAAVLLLLALVRVREPGLPGLGLTRPRAPVVLSSLAAWLAFLPLLALASTLNQVALELLGGTDGPQAYLAAFLARAETRESFTVWLGMVAVIPIAEELMYRGALYGGLRPLAGPWGAALLSGLAFGLQHDASAMVPTFGLGVLLAWLRERTGSLATPLLVHGLQNGFTLTLASLAPESLA